MTIKELVVGPPGSYKKRCSTYDLINDCYFLDTVVGIVIGAFAAVALVLIVFVAVTIWRRKKGRRLDIRNAKGMQHRNSVHTVQVNRHAEHEMKMLNH